MSGSLTSVPVVSLLAFCLLHVVWAVDNTYSPADCGTLPADVVWLLDKSGSLNEEDFTQVKNFVKHFAQKFGIGPRGLNMGVVTFNTNASTQFYLNSHPNTAAVLAAIDAISYWMPGMTNTELGLEKIRTTAFTKAHGDRGEIPNTLIVVTDGLSNNPLRTKEEAAKVHEMNVTVFAVGVGEADNDELTKIASQQQNVFHVKDFDDLDSLIDNITGAVCEETAALLPPNLTAILPPPDVNEISTASPSDTTDEMSTASPSDTTPETSTASPSETTPDYYDNYYDGSSSDQRPLPGNNEQPDRVSVPVDVVILLDNSQYIFSRDFEQIKEFMKSFANGFNVGPNGLNMGVVTFDGAPNFEFTLNSFITIGTLHGAIDRIEYSGRALPHMADALRRVRGEAFTKANGDRDYAPNILIVIADGRVADQALVKDEAAELKKTNISIFVLTSFQRITGEMSAIASKEQNIFHLPNFEDLENIHFNLIEVVSEGIPPMLPPTPAATPPSSNTPDHISVPADVVILLDNSQNMLALDFDQVKDFMKSFVNDFDVGPNGLNMGLISFDLSPYTEFWLNNYTTSSSLLAAIDHTEYVGENRPHMADALRLVRQEAFTKANGDRDDAPNILIVIAYGRFADREPVKAEAAEVKKTNVSIFVVTSFPRITGQMRAIASKDENIFHVPDFEGLENVHLNLSSAVSEEITALLPPTPAATPSASDTPAPLYFHPQPPCVDSITSCAEYGFFYCNPDSLWAQYICRRHCGACVQHCDYKGQWYSHGAKWQDGCAYDCECLDGAIGHYQCYNKCPTYLFPPPHCTLVQLPGLCCLQPVCDFGAVYQTTSGQNVGHLNGYQVCVYNGTKYYQSQRWTVGCDVECFCYDAGIGLYTCHTKCAQYGMLPSNCRLVQKPGECCAKPECEFYTTMGPFTGVGQPSGNGQSVYTVFTF